MGAVFTGVLLASGTGCAVAEVPPARVSEPAARTPAEEIEVVTVIAFGTRSSSGDSSDTTSGNGASEMKTSTDAPGTSTPAVGEDRMSILVTFARAVDPLSVRPEQFVVVTAAGTAVQPDAARLAPPGGPGETIAVELSGRFGPGTPQVVRVLGPIFSTDGVAVERESKPVEPDEVSVRPLFYMVLDTSESARLCHAREGAASDGTVSEDTAVTNDGRTASKGALRVWWSRTLQETPPRPTPWEGGLGAPLMTEGSTSVHCMGTGFTGLLDPLGTAGVMLPGGAVRDSAGRISLGGEARALPNAFNRSSAAAQPEANEVPDSPDERGRDAAPKAGVP